MIPVHRKPANVIAIDSRHTGSLPDPPPACQSRSTPRTRSRLEDAVFEAWMHGQHSQEISRKLHVGFAFIDDVLRARVTVIRRKAA